MRSNAHSLIFLYIIQFSVLFHLVRQIQNQMNDLSQEYPSCLKDNLQSSQGSLRFLRSSRLKYLFHLLFLPQYFYLTYSLTAIDLH